MGELLAGLGDLMFTLVIGYIGAIEFLYVVRHLYHWSFNHEGNESESDPATQMARLQEDMRKQLATAEEIEQQTGKKAMKDGVLYEDGFRIDPNQSEIDRLIEQLKNKSLSDARRKELEKELEKQKKIEKETRKKLEEAEAALLREQQENERKLIEAELKREREQKQREEEEEQRKRQEEEEKEAKRKAAEEEQKRRQQEEEAKAAEEARKQKEAEENNRKLIEAEQEREREQRRLELEDKAERLENEQRIFQAENEREQAQRHAEEMAEIERKLQEELAIAGEHNQELTDNERKLIESIKQREMAEQLDETSSQKDVELLQRILLAREQLEEESEEEQNQRLFAQELDREAKQRRIEENARLFLEAEKEMADMQDRMQEMVTKREFAMSLESAPQTPAEEELCIKKTIYPLRDEDSPQPKSHSVKTQLAQNSDDSYSVSTKSLLFPGVSDDASSNDPISSQKSSFSTQPSDEITTGNESQFPQQERQEPDGEDNAPAQQYSDDYLRSLDGIKQRPLSREDGSGRRRAFKKRRSSGSSNSSFDSRASREEELKMFTSLEEEEMQNADQSGFTPIKYSSEPTLKVKGHHRRHKRSPAKDMRSSDDSQRGSLERLGEETINPWGDVIPEHYKQTEFWKREKALSIDEELEMEKPTSSEEVTYDTATNMPSASSFEEATPKQNEKALTNLTKKDKISGEEETASKASTEGTTGSDINTNVSTFILL